VNLFGTISILSHFRFTNLHPKIEFKTESNLSSRLIATQYSVRKTLNSANQ